MKSTHNTAIPYFMINVCREKFELLSDLGSVSSFQSSRTYIYHKQYYILNILSAFYYLQSQAASFFRDRFGRAAGSTASVEQLLGDAWTKGDLADVDGDGTASDDDDSLIRGARRIDN